MTIREAAKLLGCTPRHLRHLCAAGRVRSRIVINGANAYYVVSRQSVLAYQRTKSPVGFPAGAKRDGLRGKIMGRQDFSPQGGGD